MADVGSQHLASSLAEDEQASLPCKVQLLVRSRTVSQIQIDKTLVWNAYLFGDRLEVVDSLFIKPDGDLLFQLRGIGIFAGI